VRGGSRSEVSAMGDRRKCQTYTASPAEPGGLPVMLARHIIGFHAAFARPRRAACAGLPGRGRNGIGTAARIAAETTLLPPFAPYSHSIVLSDRNALNLQRNIFRTCRRSASPIRQKSALLISNGNFRRSAVRSVSVTTAGRPTKRHRASQKRPSRGHVSQEPVATQTSNQSSDAWPMPAICY